MKKSIEEIIEDIQEVQVDVGGCFLRQKTIKEMKVGELLELLVPNDVRFDIYFENEDDRIIP